MTGTVGFVGAGQMGGPMVERLIAAGWKVHLFARRTPVRRRFARLGAVIQESVAAVARSVSTLIVCPFNEEQLHQIAGGPTGLIANAAVGTVVVQHATVSVEGLTGLATAGAVRGVEFLDAPVSGTAQAILAGQLTVLVGGDPGARERAEPALRAYSSSIVPTGGVGTATKVKLVNNLLFAAHVQTAGAAVRLGESLGIEPGDLLAALAKCSGNSFALDVMRQRGDPGQFAEGVAHFMRKDVAVVERLASELGLATGVLGAVVRGGPFALTGPADRSTERT
jgi:3-hydroxyisobutyrate dehydrogenase-like beta-hydroxyacid dehydrogenase